MAVWTDVSSTVLEPGDPIRSVDIIAIKENITALSEGADGAPRIKRFAVDADFSGQQLFTSSGTFVAPDNGVTLVKVTVVGGGGGGGSGSTVSYTGFFGGTGGGAGISCGYVEVTPGASYTVVVGSGGNGSNSAGGASGGTSSFGSTLLTASGGGGGGAAGDTNGSSGSSGTGGGTLMNSLLNPVSGSVVFSRPRATSSTSALAYAVGNIAARSAGAGGQGEFGSGTSNAAGGIGGAVLVEW